MTMPHPAQLRALMEAAADAAASGDDASAEPLFLQIVGINSRDADAWHMLAAIAVRNGRAGEAIDLARRALEIERRRPTYLNTLGIALSETGQLEEALGCFKRALKARPDYAEGHYNLGKAYRKLGRTEEARQCYERARRLDPANAEVANNLSRLYTSQGRHAEALALLEEACRRKPDEEGLAINLATARLVVSGPQSAIDELCDFLRTHPNATAAHAALGRRLLAQGRFAEGWREYGWRHGTAPPEVLEHAGKRVLLLPDQGLGDHLFFLRFAPALRQRAAHVAFACPDQLFGVLQDGAPVALVRGSGALREFDLSVPIGDLPYLLGAEDTPPPIALRIDDGRVAQWRERLAALGPAPYLAVTWRGGSRRADPSEFAARGENPLYKEIAIPPFAAALAKWRGTVIVVQRRPEKGEAALFERALGHRAHDLSAANEDLADMAALLSLVDEYVGVSNTNMHVRAGVGKTARVLVPFPPEFRWMHGGDETPWFPGLRVYRERPGMDWKPALERLEYDLNH